MLVQVLLVVINKLRQQSLLSSIKTFNHMVRLRMVRGGSGLCDV